MEKKSLDKNIEPTDKTLKVFKKTNEGKGLVKCKDFKDFVRQLGLK